MVCNQIELEMEGEDELWELDKLVDIYTPSEYSSEIIDRESQQLGRAFDSDTSNVIPLSAAKAQRHNIQIDGRSKAFLCDHCQRNTLYLRSAGGTHLCPACYVEQQGGRGCAICERKAGCDTCGGISDWMVVRRWRGAQITVCAQDSCMMPWGWCVKPDDSDCVCRSVVRDRMAAHLGRDLGGMLCQSIGNLDGGRFAWQKRFRFSLPDATSIQADRCMPCYVRANYKCVTPTENRRGQDVTCQCHSLDSGNSLFSSLWSPSLGNSQLSDPDQRLKRSRRKSSGDLSDE